MPSVIDEAFADLYGEPSWSVLKGYGSSLTFEFGDPCVHIGGVRERSTSFGFKWPQRFAHVHGDWRLWVYMCDVGYLHGRKIPMPLGIA